MEWADSWVVLRHLTTSTVCDQCTCKCVPCIIFVCGQAQSLGLTPDNGYVWLLFSWYGSDWWTREPVDKDYQPFSCNIELRESMVNKAIAIDHFAFVAEEDYDVVTDIGVVSM